MIEHNEGGTIVKRFHFSHVALILLALFPASSATAWDGVQVVDSSGLLRQHVFYSPSPTPAYCYWDKDPVAGPDFHATQEDGYGNYGCTYPWSVHCDRDSLAYRGSWPLIVHQHVLSSAYHVELACTVEVTAATRLVASRSIAGNLDNDDHALTIVYPDGTEVILLPPDSRIDHVELDLLPGSYEVSLLVDADRHVPVGTPIDPYEGRILLKWEDPSVDLAPTSWGSVKAVFR
jgi:hypothetical protein